LVGGALALDGWKRRDSYTNAERICRYRNARFP
jgi:hypothetical protein